MRIREITTNSLNELFDSSASAITWENDVEGRFTVDGIEYVVFFKRDAGGSNYYDFRFSDVSADDKGEMHNTGRAGVAAMKVFGIASNAVLEFLKRKRPRGLGFAGMKKDGRDVFYAKMIPYIAKRAGPIGYTMSVRSMGQPAFNSERDEYQLTRED
jgi:hypothetical protein